MDKDQIAEIFEQIAMLLELKGENPFKSRAYVNASRALLNTSTNIRELVEQERLEEIPGLGDALKQKITELVKTGRLDYYEKLRDSFPATLPELFEINGLGPKKIKLLYDKLGVSSVAMLEQACKEGKVAELPGLGKKTEVNILEAIEQRKQFSNQHLYADVIGVGWKIESELRENPAVLRIALAGSLRRGKEVLKDLDILVSSAEPEAVMEQFCTLPGIVKVLGHGSTKSSVIFDNGLQCDLRVVSDKVFPYALHHFTGSKEHNVAMRQRAIERGMKLSEWGLFSVKPAVSPEIPAEETLIPCNDEADIFRKLGLDEVPPEMRENLGEIEAAEAGQLPRLVQWTELRGTFHNHTHASDGRNSLEEMAEAARELGLEYLGIADHSKSSFQANGLTAERLLEQVAEIRRLNEGWSDFALLAGSEVDILKDGTLDFSDDVLAQLDYCVASVHASFTLDEETMTKRIIRAAENPYVTMLGHLTGRLLLQRPPYAVNVQKVIEACAANGCWIELNASPYRLDMDWRWWHFARDKGVLCAINPDAHRTEQLTYLRLGVNIARKGWLRKEDVINTRSLSEVKERIAAARAGRLSAV